MFGFKPSRPDSDTIDRTFAAGGHVLKGVDLDIETGTVVAIAGASGSGKTTLLRLLAGALPPTEGRIELAGPVSALIDVGDNLEPSQTARENIDNQRRLKRISRTVAEAYARDVIAFAGLAGFEDVPVERYSTGMRMRLSVALALEGDPPILVIDDVLGVGDIAFQQDCVERLLRLKDAGSTIIMVSADETLLHRMGCRVVTLAGGRIAAQAAAPGRSDATGGDVESQWQIADLYPENDMVAIRRVTAAASEWEHRKAIELTVEIETKAAQRMRPLVDVFVDKMPVLRSLYPSYLEMTGADRLIFKVPVPVHLLSARRFRVDLSVVSYQGPQVYSLKTSGLMALEIKRGLTDGETPGPIVLVPFDWEIAPVSE